MKSKKTVKNAKKAISSEWVCHGFDCSLLSNKYVLFYIDLNIDVSLKITTQ